MLPFPASQAAPADAWHDLPAESAVRLVQDIDRSTVGLNPDLGNLFRLHRDIESFQSAVEACLPLSNYWHVKNYSRDTEPATGAVVALPAPMYSGSMNYRAAVKTAVDLGYTGPFLSLIH